MRTATLPLDRISLDDWYARNRRRSARLFATIGDEAFYSRPIPLRHPFIFYEGHIPAFSFLTLNERALGETPLDPTFERLFERGIDPGSVQDAAQHQRADWPSRASVQAFGLACDERIERAIASARLEDPAVPRSDTRASPLHHPRTRTNAPRNAGVHRAPARVRA